MQPKVRGGARQSDTHRFFRYRKLLPSLQQLRGGGGRAPGATTRHCVVDSRRGEERRGEAGYSHDAPANNANRTQRGRCHLRHAVWERFRPLCAGTAAAGQLAGSRAGTARLSMPLIARQPPPAAADGFISRRLAAPRHFAAAVRVNGGHFCCTACAIVLLYCC